MSRTLFSFIASSIVLLPATFLMTGCGEKLPDGMPRLYPASITVTQEGEPLAGALVQLIPEDPVNSAWGPGGNTDASGVVVLQTNGRYRGAPLGKYRVTVTKMETDPHPNPEWMNAPSDSPEFRQNMEISRRLRVYHLVDPQLRSTTDTPLRLEVTAGEKNYTIDVGEKVRVEARILR